MEINDKTLAKKNKIETEKNETENKTDRRKTYIVIDYSCL